MSTALKLAISRVDLETIIEYARHDYPYETCGMIGGRDHTARIVAPLPNSSPTPRVHYEIERQAMVDSVMRFHKLGLEVVAIYHSHPDAPAVPSALDIAQAAWPDAVYLIVGLQDPEQPDVCAWLIRNGDVQPVELEITDWSPAA
jgi:proteasome lid subunit RPN8/RPN11